jgi:16S rRNA (cytidine1402-2'-O)-methyltransferase
MQAILYLLPVPLSDAPANKVIPVSVTNLINRLDHFIVENFRTARRQLKKMGFNRSFDALTFYQLDEHTSENEFDELMSPLKNGYSTGLMSEAGVPVIADPGSDFILHVQQAGFRVIPMTGPSSVILALMASGLNGQNFAFNGYLPVQQGARIRKLREIEKISLGTGQAQIFIETPYRNTSLLRDIISCCQPGTYLCIAADLTADNEFISTKTVAKWKGRLPDIDKHPAIFILSGGRQRIT